MNDAKRIAKLEAQIESLRSRLAARTDQLLLVLLQIDDLKREDMAPDLLSALREIADDYADRFDMDSPSTNPGMKYVVKQARAAIAKATGKDAP